jgi:hypothetical protein
VTLNLSHSGPNRSRGPGGADQLSSSESQYR